MKVYAVPLFPARPVRLINEGTNQDWKRFTVEYSRQICIQKSSALEVKFRIILTDIHEQKLFKIIWNGIETLQILSWISFKLSREYLVHLNWMKLAFDPCGLDKSTGRATDRYPKGASSNPVRDKIFQLTSAVSDYHEKFLFIRS